MSLLLDNSPNEICFSKNPIFFKLSTNKYSVVIDIYIESFHNSRSFSKIISQSFIADTFGIVETSIEEIINSYLEHTLPTYGTTTIEELKKNIKRFYLVAKSYDTSGIFSDTLTINNSGNYFTALLGGINHEEYPTAGFFQNYLPTNLIFLSWKGQNISIDESMPYFLDYLAIDNYAIPYLHVKFYYSDNSTSLNSITPAALNQYDLIRIPVDFTTISAMASAGKTISKYEVYLENYNGATFDIISETITFTIDRNHYEDVKYFLYFNSLSGLDCLRTSAASDFMFPIQKNNASLNLNANFIAKDGTYIDFNKLENQKFTTYTGYLSREEIDKLRDMFLSDEIFLIFKGQYLTVLLNSEVGYTNFEEYFSLKIEYSFNFSNHVYTPTQLRTIQPETFTRIINAAGDKRLINSTDKRIYHG